MQIKHVFILSLGALCLVSNAQAGPRIDAVFIKQITLKKARWGIIPEAFADEEAAAKFKQLHQSCQEQSSGKFFHPSFGVHTHDEKEKSSPEAPQDPKAIKSTSNDSSLVKSGLSKGTRPDEIMEGEMCPEMGGSFCVKKNGVAVVAKVNTPGRTGPTLELVIDVSNSMEAVDPGSGEPRNCFRQKALMEYLPKLKNWNVGAIAYDHKSFNEIIPQPIATNWNVISKFLQEQACFPGFGTDVPNALSAAKKAIGSGTGQDRILILTDEGEATTELMGMVSGSGGQSRFVLREDLAKIISELLGV